MRIVLVKERMRIQIRDASFFAFNQINPIIPFKMSSEDTVMNDAAPIASNGKGKGKQLEVAQGQEADLLPW